MKKPVRILVQILVPPAVGGTIAFTIFSAKEAQAGVGTALILSALSIVYAYAFAFIPSCIYAFAMETAFGAGLNRKSVGTFMLSSFLGGMGGFAIGWFFKPQLAHVVGVYSSIGAVTGLTTAVIVDVFSKEEGPPVPAQGIET